MSCRAIMPCFLKKPLFKLGISLNDRLIKRHNIVANVLLSNTCTVAMDTCISFIHVWQCFKFTFPGCLMSAVNGQSAKSGSTASKESQPSSFAWLFPAMISYWPKTKR